MVHSRAVLHKLVQKVLVQMNKKLSILLLLSGGLLSCSEKNEQLHAAKLNQLASVDTTPATHITKDSAKFEIKGNHKMQVKLGQYAFALPDDWRDTSSYIFKTNDQKQALTVSFGKTREPLSLDELVTQRRQQLTDSMGDEVEFIAQGKGAISSLPAIYLSFEFGDQDKQYQEHWATAYYAENKYVTASYVGPKEDELLGATFKHIMETCLPSSQSVATQTTADYVWRNVHILLLKLPKALRPPRHYTYASPSGIKLKASLYNPGDDWPQGSVEEDASKDLRFGGAKGDIQNGEFGGFSVQQLEYEFQGGDPLEPTKYKAYRAQVAGLGGRLYLYVKGFESQTTQVNEVWHQLLASLQPNGEMLDEPVPVEEGKAL